MQYPIFAYILLKLAARCNLDCSYCYWFRDPSVYDKPKKLTEDAEQAFVHHLEHHLELYDIDEFTILLHGGEPMLFGKVRFEKFLDRLEGIKKRTGRKLVYLITTNGVLMDDEWVELFDRFNVYVSISIDGPAEIHDQNRLDFKGNGSHAGAVEAIDKLRAAGRKPGVIAVCNLDHDPKRVLQHIVNDLGIKKFDILPPDFNHEDEVTSIASYYKRLFDVWYDEFAEQGVRVAILDGIIGGLLGQQPITDSIGAGPVHTVTMLTDGSLEPLDVLRIGGGKDAAPNFNITTHTFQDVTRDLVWTEAYDASLELCDQCINCRYTEACGGGHLAHRWSKANGYHNPSVYCNDWIEIFDHVWHRFAPDIKLEAGEQSISLLQAMETVGAFNDPSGIALP